MPVFFVHDVNHGIVKPLDRKFRVREISPVQEASSTQAIHPKTDSHFSDFQTIHSNTNKEQSSQQQKQPFESTQKAIQAYQDVLSVCQSRSHVIAPQNQIDPGAF